MSKTVRMMLCHRPKRIEMIVIYEGKTKLGTKIRLVKTPVGKYVLYRYNHVSKCWHWVTSESALREGYEKLKKIFDNMVK